MEFESLYLDLNFSSVSSQFLSNITTTINNNNHYNHPTFPHQPPYINQNEGHSLLQLHRRCHRHAGCQHRLATLRRLLPQRPVLCHRRPRRRRPQLRYSYVYTTSSFNLNKKRLTNLPFLQNSSRHPPQLRRVHRCLLRDRSASQVLCYPYPRPGSHLPEPSISDEGFYLS